MKTFQWQPAQHMIRLLIIFKGEEIKPWNVTQFNLGVYTSIGNNPKSETIQFDGYSL